MGNNISDKDKIASLKSKQRERKQSNRNQIHPEGGALKVAAGTTVGVGVVQSDHVTIMADGTHVSAIPAENGMNEILRILHVYEQAQEDKAESDANNSDWMLIAKVLDRFLFWVFLIASVSMTAVLMTAHPEYPEKPYDYVP